MTVTIERGRRGYVLRESIELATPLADLFPFFCDAGNLDQLTPPSLRFRILSPAPIEMREGAEIEYSIRIRGLPVRWRTLISEWNPPHAFTDQQLRGPYRWWRHRHAFEDRGATTVMHDTVEYGIPGGPAVHALAVKRDLLSIFTYRSGRAAELFGAVPSPALKPLPSPVPS